MNIGVIGRADGPTSIFVTSSINQYTIVALTAVIIATFAIIRAIKKRKNNK